MSTNVDLHEVNLASSSKLKLRATALLAEGTSKSTFEACVLFHEAARFERRAIEALSPCPPATRLTALIEECWCLLEGRDPDAAAEVWSRVLNEAQHVDSKTSESLLSRLRPRYDRAIREFVALIQSCTRLRTGSVALLRGAESMVPASRSDRNAMLRELRRVLRDYPGIPSLWGLLASFENANERPHESWNALQRALRLAPDNQQFRALSLTAAVEALSRADANAYLAQVRPTLHRMSAEVCLMYAFAEIQLAGDKGARRAQHWQRALEAIHVAFPRTHSEGLRKNLTALQLLLREMAAGRKVDTEILYRAGLGGLAATGGGSVIDLLRQDAHARIREMDTDDVAA